MTVKRTTLWVSPEVRGAIKRMKDSNESVNDYLLKILKIKPIYSEKIKVLGEIKYE